MEHLKQFVLLTALGALAPVQAATSLMACEPGGYYCCCNTNVSQPDFSSIPDLQEREFQRQQWEQQNHTAEKCNLRTGPYASKLLNGETIEACRTNNETNDGFTLEPSYSGGTKPWGPKSIDFPSPPRVMHPACWVQYIPPVCSLSTTNDPPSTIPWAGGGMSIVPDDYPNQLPIPESQPSPKPAPLLVPPEGMWTPRFIPGTSNIDPDSPYQTIPPSPLPEGWQPPQWDLPHWPKIGPLPAPSPSPSPPCEIIPGTPDQVICPAPVPTTSPSPDPSASPSGSPSPEPEPSPT